MYLLAAIPFFLVASWLVVVVLRLRALNARLRANLAGCAGYPVFPSFRRSASLLDPLRAWGRAAERRWQYRVDVSTLGRVVVTRYFDARFAAARFMRRWRRVPQASVAVHGERWA